jgi:hypothetical protein
MSLKLRQKPQRRVHLFRTLYRPSTSLDDDYLQTVSRIAKLNSHNHPASYMFLLCSLLATYQAYTHYYTLSLLWTFSVLGTIMEEESPFNVHTSFFRIIYSFARQRTAGCLWIPSLPWTAVHSYETENLYQHNSRIFNWSFNSMWINCTNIWSVTP